MGRVVCIALWIVMLSVQSASLPAPALQVIAPPQLASVAKHIEALGREDFTELLVLTGRMGFTQPVKVVLITEDHPVAHETPAWVSGYARSDRRTVVLFPARVPSYPDRNLRALVRHEVAHILVWEAAGGRHVPRWLNEGIATVAAREWGLEDRARYAAAVLGRSPRSTRQLDAAFRGSASEARRAYALSSAFVRHLRTEYGSSTPAEILRGIRQGLAIDDAFQRAVGRDLKTVERRFFREQAFWNTWVPFLTSSVALWMAVTALALLAFVRRRARSLAMHESWEMEELAAEQDEGTSQSSREPGDDKVVIN